MPNRKKPSPRCDATYTTVGGRRFRCDIAPHPGKPDAHYFVRDGDAPAPRRRRSLHTVPGERNAEA